MSDPFIVCSVLVFGSLALSVVIGTIDACVSKGPQATLSMRVGMRVFVLVSWGTTRSFRQTLVDSVRNGTYTFWSRVFDRIGGCWVVTFSVASCMLGAWAVFFT